MTTIHIHLTDVTDVGALIDLVRLRYGGSTITIDDQPATQVATEPWYRQTYPSGTDYDWAIQRAEERIHRFQIDEMEYDRVISLDCPFCGAVAGKGCHTATGALKPRPVTHAARKAALGEYETATPVATSLPDWISNPITLDEM